jgi:hypothetical protein
MFFAVECPWIPAFAGMMVLMGVMSIQVSLLTVIYVIPAKAGIQRCACAGK